MRILKKCFDFYIDSSIHVAIEGVALVWITLLKFSLPVSWSLFGFVFFGIITGYNFVKYAEIAGLHHKNLRIGLKSIQIFSFISFLFLIYFTTKQNWETILTVTIFGFFTILYAVPLVKHKNLRNFSSLKIFIVALVWAGVTVIVPIVYNQANLDYDVVITFMQRFLLIIVLVLPFDIRDLQFDNEKLRTLPQIMGIVNSKILGTILLILTGLLEFLKSEPEKDSIIALLFFLLLILFFLWGSKVERGRYYTSFWVESAAIFWVILYTILKIYV